MLEGMRIMPEWTDPDSYVCASESRNAPCGHEGSMGMATRKRHSPGQAVRKHTPADGLLAEGKDVAAVCREAGGPDAQATAPRAEWEKTALKEIANI